jgi:hypothetical protein
MRRDQRLRRRQPGVRRLGISLDDRREIGAGISEQIFDAALREEPDTPPRRCRPSIPCAPCHAPAIRYRSEHSARMLSENSALGSSEQIQEFGAAETGLPQDGGNGAGRKIPPMHRDDRLSGGIIAVPQKMMRSLAPDDLESSPLQRRDNATARQRWKRSHALDSATGTNWSIGEVKSRSGDGRALPSSSITSKHSSIASRALAWASSRVSPKVMTGGNLGHVTVKPPSGSGRK